MFFGAQAANTGVITMKYKLMDSQHAIDDVNNLHDLFSVQWS